MKEDDKKMLSLLLREARGKLNLTQQDVSSLSGIGFRTYQRLENCEIRPKFETVLKVCKVLGKDVLEDFNNYLNRKRTTRKEKLILAKDSDCPVTITEHSSFSELELEAFKKLLICTCSRDLSMIGHWEMNIDLSRLYWCNRMKELYDLPKHQGLNNKQIVSRLSEVDSETYLKAFDGLVHDGIPLELKHRVKSENIDHIVEKKALRLTNKEGHKIIYAIAFLS